MFRCIWWLATEMRDAMIREERGEELETLVFKARTFRESLRRQVAGSET